MPSNIELHLDREIQQLSLKKAATLEFRACCICGVIKRADDMEECIACDEFMCAEHNYAEHACQFSAEKLPIRLLTSNLPKSKALSKKK